MSRTDIPVAAALISCFTDGQYEMIAQFVHRYGSSGPSEARAMTARLGCWPPLLSFIPEGFLSGEEASQLIAGLRLRIADMLSKSSTVDDWANALVRDFGLDGPTAHDMATQIVTADISLRGMVLNMFSYLPSVFGGAAANAAGVAAGFIQQLLPQLWFDRSNDEVYTTLRAGRVLGELYLKAALSRAEVKAESGAAGQNTNPNAPKESHAASQLMESLLGAALGWVIAPWAGPFSAVLGGMAGHQLANPNQPMNAPALPGQTGTPAEAPPPPPPPPMGVPTGDVEFGDVEQALPHDVRFLAANALRKIGELGAPATNVGGFSTFYKNMVHHASPVIRAASPFVQTNLGNGLNGPAGSTLVNSLDPHLRSSFPIGDAQTIAVLRAPIASTMQDHGKMHRLLQLINAKGTGTTLQEFMEAIC